MEEPLGPEEDMIERVARALAVAHCKGGGAMPLLANGHVMDYQQYADSFWPFFQFPARAAIEAMGEPTERMKAAITILAWRSGAAQKPEWVWEAAIDAALIKPSAAALPPNALKHPG